MKARSAKNKGNRFENYLVERLREDVDLDTSRSYGSGAGLDKGDVRIPSHDIVIEAKNHKSIYLTKWWEQTEEQAIAGDTGVLAIRHPKFKEFDKTLVVIDFEYFIELLNNQGGQVEVEMKMDYPKKRALDRLKTAISNVNKEFKLVD